MTAMKMSDLDRILGKRRRAGIRYDLKRMEALMKSMDHPERRIRTVHIAGTNGKGSVAAFTGRILEAAGLVTGGFQSPVFGPLHHHITVGEASLEEAAFLEAAKSFEDLVKRTEEQQSLGMISEFEWLTGMAFYIWDKVEPVDVAIVEAGMGGRLDSTNVTPSPLATVITNVGLDHQAFLGDTIEAIAAEKAGILKTGVPCFTSAKEPALSVIRERGEKTGAEVITVLAPRLSIPLAMTGDHQQLNAAVAKRTAAYVLRVFGTSLEEAEMNAALRHLQVPGRFERLRKNPDVIVDTAHNTEAIRTTIANIRTFYEPKEVSVLFAAMQDKPASAMLQMLEEAGMKPAVTDFLHPRALKRGAYPAYYEQARDAGDWVSAWLKQATEEDVLLITGSHQFIGEMREHVTKC